MVNKYLHTYFAIIRFRKNNPIESSVYSEKHHIIPRSLGGSDDESNLVALTAREHYIVHVLLFKIFQRRARIAVLAKKDKQRNALVNMACALRFMGDSASAMSKAQNRHIKYNSRLFEQLRIQANQCRYQYDLPTLKEMYEFYIVNNCSQNAKKYAELQERFNYSATKKSLCEMFTRHGFTLEQDMRYVKNRKLIAMYADFMNNKEFYKTAKGYEQFQEKWAFWSSRKALTNLFSERGLKVSALDSAWEGVIDIILKIEKKFQAFTQNIMIKLNELGLTEKQQNICNQMIATVAN